MNKWYTNENGIIRSGIIDLNEKEFKNLLKDGVKLKFVKEERGEEK